MIIVAGGDNMIWVSELQDSLNRDSEWMHPVKDHDSVLNQIEIINNR